MDSVEGGELQIREERKVWVGGTLRKSESRMGSRCLIMTRLPLFEYRVSDEANVTALQRPDMFCNARCNLGEAGGRVGYVCARGWR
eukprot:2159582-Rhodomonas_salina.1